MEPACRGGDDMKKARAYFYFFLVIVLLSSLGVAAEKAVRSVKAEYAMSHSFHQQEEADPVNQDLSSGGIRQQR
jgi:hypothetical protein